MAEVKTVNPQIEASWLEVLKGEFEQPYFLEIKRFLIKEKEAGKVIYPSGPLIFNAFNKTPFDKVKVVILGQDPYPNPKQAHGLSFSVPHGITTPRSLKRIYKEMNDDLGIPIANHGNLEKWAEQGVFLLNATLTVQHKNSNSHSKIGWQTFTDGVIRQLSERKEGLVFLLWGGFAKKKKKLIDTSKHHVLEAAHPSPLAGDAFFGNKHFSQANQLLEQQGKEPIDWDIS